MIHIDLTAICSLLLTIIIIFIMSIWFYEIELAIIADALMLIHFLKFQYNIYNYNDNNIAHFLLLIIFSIFDLIVLSYMLDIYRIYYHLFYMILAIFGCIRHTCIHFYVIPNPIISDQNMNIV